MGFLLPTDLPHHCKWSGGRDKLTFPASTAQDSPLDGYNQPSAATARYPPLSGDNPPASTSIPQNGIETRSLPTERPRTASALCTCSGVFE